MNENTNHCCMVAAEDSSNAKIEKKKKQRKTNFILKPDFLNSDFTTD